MEFGDIRSCVAFQQYFESIPALPEGTELSFTWTPDDKLISAMNDQQLGLLQSRMLCEALFDVYVGQDPVSPVAKQTLLDRL